MHTVKHHVADKKRYDFTLCTTSIYSLTYCCSVILVKKKGEEIIFKKGRVQHYRNNKININRISLN